MASKRPSTIAEYIKAAPKVAQPHLNQLYGILKSVAPDAQETIKWGNPFFVDPRFVFAFSAHKAHLSFAPTPEALEAFRKDLKSYQTTDNFLKILYSQPIPEDLIRKIAKYRLKSLKNRKDDNFW